MKATAPCGIVSVCVLALSAEAAMINVQSGTDGTGLYFYTLSCGDEPYWFGGDSNILAVSVASLAILGISTPPGWSSSTDIQNRITWRRTDGAPWLCGTNAVTFSLTSAIHTACWYTGPLDSAEFPCGTVVGEVYGTNGILFRASSTNGTASANVVGYETFISVGPVPEPYLLAALCVLLFGFARRHRTRSDSIMRVPLAIAAAQDYRLLVKDSAQLTQGRVRKTGGDTVLVKEGGWI